MKIIISLIIAFFIASVINAQEWKWNWAVPPVTDLAACTKNAGTPAIDRHNNICQAFSYWDELNVYNLHFSHIPIQVNPAIILHDKDGNFIRGIDIFSSSDQWGYISSPKIVADTEGNFYIGCYFRKFIVISNDTMIIRPPWVTEEYTSMALIVRLGPDLELQWVRLISSSGSVSFNDMVIGKDGYLYADVSHDIGDSSFVDYFGQDTITYSQSNDAILKISADGNLIWRKNLFFENNLIVTNLTYGSDGTIYHLSTPHGPCYYGDTEIPFTPNFTNTCSNVLQIDTGGNLVRWKRFPGMYIEHIIPAEEGNYAFSSWYYNKCIAWNDTLTLSGDSTGSIIGLLDNQMEPIWYRQAISEGTAPYFKVIPMNGKLYFAGDFTRNTSFCDTTFSLAYRTKTMVGRLSEDGDLEKYIFYYSNANMHTYSLVKDNCGNLLIAGQYTNKLIAGDTLFSPGGSGFTAKLQIKEPYKGLGNDTTACDRITLSVPDEFIWHEWNGGTSNGQTLTVTEPGVYYVDVHDANYCWGTDTISIGIINTPEHILGNDVIITRTGSAAISFNIPYLHCIWSTGDTTSSIVVKGEVLGVGEHLITVEVQTETCPVYDTINVLVKWGNGIDDISENRLSVRPNPAAENLYVTLPAGIKEVTLTDLSGKVVFRNSYSDSDINEIIIDVKAFSSGIYFIKAVSGKKVYQQRILINH